MQGKAAAAGVTVFMVFVLAVASSTQYQNDISDGVDGNTGITSTPTPSLAPVEPTPFSTPQPTPTPPIIDEENESMVLIGCYDVSFYYRYATPTQFIQKLVGDTGKGVALFGNFMSIGAGGITSMSSTINTMINQGLIAGFFTTIVIGTQNAEYMTTNGYENCVHIINGDYDSVIDNFAADLHLINGPVYVSFGAEENAFWAGTICQNPSIFVQAMQRFYSRIKAVDSNIQIGTYFVPPPDVYNPSTSTWGQGSYPLSYYYSGDSYCDWWGIDMYANWIFETGLTVSQYYSTLGALNMHPTKPFAIPELGPKWDWYPNESQESTWLSQYLSWMATNDDRISFFVMYDSGGLAGYEAFDWGFGPANTHPQFYSAYVSGIQNAAFTDESVFPITTKSYIFDAWLAEEQHETYGKSFDGYLKLEQTLAEPSFDGELTDTGTKDVVFDAWLEKMAYKNVAFDAVLWLAGAGFMEFDADLLDMFTKAYPSFDAWLQATVPGTFIFDGFMIGRLARVTFDGFLEWFTATVSQLGLLTSVIAMMEEEEIGKYCFEAGCVEPGCDNVDTPLRRIIREMENE